MTVYKNKILFTNPQEILQKEMEYFKAVFSNDKKLEPTSSMTEQFFSSNKAFKLPAVQQASLEREITEQELGTIDSFSTGKSPGIDGITCYLFLLLRYIKPFMKKSKNPF